jgi:CheY-like chemotaxis protein
MKHILVVEDHEVQASLLRFSLNAQGYEVTTVESAEDALKILQEETHIDLITLDINLTGMSGTQFLAQLRKDPRYKEIPVIIITALRQEHYVNETRALGVKDYLVKPIVFAEFTALLEEYLT